MFRMARTSVTSRPGGPQLEGQGHIISVAMCGMPWGHPTHQVTANIDGTAILRAGAECDRSGCLRASEPGTRHDPDSIQCFTLATSWHIG